MGDLALIENDALEGLNNLGRELSSRTLLEFRYRLRGESSGPIGSVGHHGIVGVGDGDDVGLDGRIIVHLASGSIARVVMFDDVNEVQS